MMLVPPIPKNEAQRLLALHNLCLLDTPKDPAFDQMTRLAAQVFGTSMALISLVDEGRQWFKSRMGVTMRETPRSQAFCAYALLSPEILVVLDTRHDPRFANNPLVTGTPNLRFYAGAPLLTADGLCLGTFCVLGSEPRADFNMVQRELLSNFARLAMMRIETLRSIGYMDSLTHLPNRTRFHEDVAMWLTDTPDSDQQLYAAAIDVCGIAYLQQMQAALGSDYTDGFLVATSARIAHALAPAPVYRIDTNVFACILKARNETDLAMQLQSMQVEFSIAIDHQGIPHAPQVLIGTVDLASQSNSGDTARALGAALVHARTYRLPWTIYHQQVDLMQQRAFRILAAIPAALVSADQLQMHFQPRVNLATGICTGVEALLRWVHPQLGSIGPGEFIPLAEKTALIHEISAWVLRTTIRQAERWQAVGQRLVVALNVSALDLESSAFADLMAELLTRHSVDPSLLEIEFTESAIADDPHSVQNQLLRLRAMGLQIAIDDFGTGYSNLSYLKQIPATTLKIDQSFVRKLPRDMDDVTLICTMLRLGHEFGYSVVAEGIETQEAYDLLSGWGCEEGQGYFIARPMPAEQLKEWLSSNKNQ